MPPPSYVQVAVVIGSVACLMIFKAWCRHHIGGPYATVVATAVLNLIIIIILGEVGNNILRSAIVVLNYRAKITAPSM